MKFTPFLSVLNTVGSLIVGLYLVVAMGVAGNVDVFSTLVVPILLFILLANVITGWMVVFKGSNGAHASIWRVTATISILIVLFLAATSIFHAS